ncbi:MAG: hypothetical protein CM15mV40_260 [Caudoviricetes sp.]|nr:MAG: hypothetical protein CM15mV40_260 [Caudoviricetes sp.]
MPEAQEPHGVCSRMRYARSINAPACQRESRPGGFAAHQLQVIRNGWDNAVLSRRQLSAGGERAQQEAITV